MSLFRVTVIARNPKQEEIATPPIEAIVDTGSELIWSPATQIRRHHAAPQAALRHRHAAKVQRDVGVAIVAAEGYETIDEVVFAKPGDMFL